MNPLRYKSIGYVGILNWFREPMLGRFSIVDRKNRNSKFNRPFSCVSLHCEARKSNKTSPVDINQNGLILFLMIALTAFITLAYRLYRADWIARYLRLAFKF